MVTPSSIHKIPREQVFKDPRIPLAVLRIEQQGASPHPHGHAFEELVIIVDGWGHHRVGEFDYEIHAGEIFVLNGKMTHHYPDARKLSLINILFDSATLNFMDWDLGEIPGYHALFAIEPHMRWIASFRNRLRLDLDELSAVTAMVREIEHELNDRRAGYRFLALAHFRRLVAFLSRRYSEIPDTHLNGAEQLSRVLSYIERHYAETIDIATLCNIGCLSRSSLMRKFRAVTGNSPADYLIRYRIGQAQRLLRNTSLPISEIGLATGFCDGNYFTRQFRRITGATPSKWRRTAAHNTAPGCRVHGLPPMHSTPE